MRLLLRASLRYLTLILACDFTRAHFTGGRRAKEDICVAPVIETPALIQTGPERSHNVSERIRPGAQELFSRIYKYQLLIPRPLLVRSFSNYGSVGEIQRALQKLAKGKPVTVVALGGSISAGHGVADPENGWISRVFAWIESTFPHHGHKLLNRAIPAVTSGYVSACIPDLVPDDADLVILEFTYNDWVFSRGDRTVNDASRRGLERLLRRLLVHPAKPGILYLHYWPAARFLPAFLNDEELMDTLLHYYGIPTLSMRNALHGLLAQTPELLDHLWKPAPDPKIHPTCVGARMMADLVIGYLQQMAAALLEDPLGSLMFGADSLSGQQPFLLEGNWGHTHSVCILEQDLPALVTLNKGWEWRDEGKAHTQHKRGFISEAPGNRLDLKVPLDALPDGSPSKAFLVGIGGLISYEHMGSMALTCTGGCLCPAVQHSMYHDAKFSMTGWRYVNVTQVGTNDCIITALNAAESSTGEHKLKISSLMISAKGETVEGTNGSMLSQALTNLHSSKPLTTSRRHRHKASRRFPI